MKTLTYVLYLMNFTDGFKIWLFCDEMAMFERFPSELHFHPTTTVMCNAIAALEQFCDIATETTVMTGAERRNVGYNKLLVLVWVFALPPLSRPFLS